jgi:hypothetical protein
MRRFAVFAALTLTVLSYAAAQDTVDPNQEFKEGKVGLVLPDDATSTIDTGTWIAYSDSNDMTLMFDKYEKVLTGKELTEKNVAKACADNGVTAFKFIKQNEDTGLVWAYGRGTYKSKKGAYEGFFGLLVNADVKKKTFFFALMVPSLRKQATYDLAVDIVDTMVPME